MIQYAAGFKNRIIYLMDGADTLFYSFGDDVIYGNQGNNVIYGTAGDDLRCFIEWYPPSRISRVLRIGQHSAIWRFGLQSSDD